MSATLKGLSRLLRRLLDGLFFAVVLSVGAVVVLMVAIISYGVVAREVFSLSDVWITEVTTYLMGYMTFVGSAALAWRGRHVRIDAFGHFLSPGVRQGLALAASVVVTAVSLVLLWLAASFWWDAWDSDERSWGMLSMPLWIPYLSLAAGSALLTLANAVRFVLLLQAGSGDPAGAGAGRT
jgi:TRAP-type C4-dicarboxylate transport system permease small subunit